MRHLIDPLDFSQEEIMNLLSLADRICADPAFGISMEDLRPILDSHNYVGLAPEQTEEFVRTVVQPLLSSGEEIVGSEISV